MTEDPFDRLASDPGIAEAAAEHSEAWEAEQTCAVPGCEHLVFDPARECRLRMGEVAFDILHLAEFLERNYPRLDQDQALKVATDAAAIASNEACM